MKHSFKTGVITSVLALSLITSAGLPPVAHAASVAELQAQIANLLAQLNALQAQISSTTNTPIILNLSRNLAQGMSGSDVQALQRFLNTDPTTRVAQNGAGAPGNETLFFGPATKAAVIKFQNKYQTEVLTPVGLSTGTGFVGASTRAQIAKLTTNNPDTPNPTPSPNPSPTVQEEGDISVTLGNERTNTLELNGNPDAIYSVEVEAEDADMTINRVDFIFDKKPWNYVDSFVLYLDSKKIGEIKPSSSNITEAGDEYRLRFSGLNAVIDKNDDAELILEAKALKSLSSNRVNDSLSVYLPKDGIRALDTAKLTSQAPSSNLSNRTFNFRDADNDGDLDVSLSAQSPQSGAIVVKASANTTNKTVLITTVEADGNDLIVNDIYVKVDSSEANVANVVRNLSLVFAGETIATEAVRKNTGGNITGKDKFGTTYTIIATNEYYAHFDNLDDIELDEGDREELSVVAEFFKQSGRYSTGTEVTFTLRAIEAENKAGEDINAGDLTIGDNRDFTLFIDGLTFSFVDGDAKTTGSQNKTGDYTITFDVTAFGDDIYVPMTSDRLTSTSSVSNAAITYSIVDGSRVQYADAVTFDSIDIDGAKESGNFYRLTKSNTYRVTLNVSLNNTGGTQDFYRAVINSFSYRVGSPTGTLTTITTGFADFRTNATSVSS